MSTEIAVPETKEEKKSVVTRMADRYGMDGRKFYSMVKNQVFRQKDASDEQLMAVMVVADQYKLNPITGEIYAFPDKHKGIVPVVGVDGWSRIINEHPQFDGMEFHYDKDEESMTCTIYRKDRSHPTSVTEYMDEVKRNTQPWQSHPKRMLRHKTMIQAARMAFGFAGIYDHDEADRIRESTGSNDEISATRDSYRKDLAEEIEVMLCEQRGQDQAAWFRDNAGKMFKTVESLEAFRDKLKAEASESQEHPEVDAEQSEEAGGEDSSQFAIFEPNEDEIY